MPVSGEYRFALGANAQYLSTFNSNADHSSGAYFGPIWLLGANASLYTESSNSWRIELIGRNLLNETYLGVSFDRTGAPAGSTDQYGPINRPREIWIQVTKNIGR
jgi:hypothetical protein